MEDLARETSPVGPYRTAIRKRMCAFGRAVDGEAFSRCPVLEVNRARGWGGGNRDWLCMCRLNLPAIRYQRHNDTE